MTRNELLYLCNEHCITVELALENVDIISALLDRDDAQVVKLLNTEF